jgi:putative NIF3 family GTP cyclohydrolase 1 type 2
MVERTALLALCHGLLKPEQFKDYCPNGLQVEGRPQIQTIASGVTASLAFIQAAIDAGADTLLVHHGLVWRNQTGSVTGWLKSRLALLLAHDINACDHLGDGVFDLNARVHLDKIKAAIFIQKF